MKDFEFEVEFDPGVRMPPISSREFVMVSIERYEKMRAVIVSAIFHAKFPHDDTLERLQKDVEVLPWEEVSDATTDVLIAEQGE